MVEGEWRWWTESGGGGSRVASPAHAGYSALLALNIDGTLGLSLRGIVDECLGGCEEHDVTFLWMWRCERGWERCEHGW